MYEDKIIICKECGKEFVFCAGEQEFFASKGFREAPKRCKECGKARRKPKIHEIICSKCGAKAFVPFLPKEGKPVYCDICYQLDSELQ